MWIFHSTNLTIDRLINVYLRILSVTMSSKENRNQKCGLLNKNSINDFHSISIAYAIKRKAIQIHQIWFVVFPIADNQRILFLISSAIILILSLLQNVFGHRAYTWY